METKTMKIGEHTVEVKEYITGKDQREYQGVLYGKMKLSADSLTIGNTVVPKEGNVTPKIDAIPADVLLELDTKMIELLVVSLDGDKQDLINRVDALRAEDYNTLIGELRLFFRSE